jgi:hypothetical protein
MPSRNQYKYESVKYLHFLPESWLDEMKSGAGQIGNLSIQYHRQAETTRQ